ncbi:MAG: serine/threonine-protein kinase [Sorangiineae bacterium]|nr:serine/threonine-protein kinase [Polyangiaceae bacterium]MEB2322309.1 serine/threonine-protein kinase [Sorangiineae bacterium]
MKCEACGTENIDGARFCAGCGALLPVESKGEDPLVGQVIGGRYRITDVLGEGGMGIVYGAEQQMGSTLRKVAVKTLHAHLSKDPSVRERFNRECGTVAQLEHPNTIKFFDFGSTSDGTLYIAMEFVKGESLMNAIEKGGPMAPDRMLKIMRQVCGALDEAHKQGIIHRDLKPENIVLTERAGEKDFVKVLDFGIAARSESADAQKEAKLTQQGMVLGTPPYMSPEQFTGKALDMRSDIYSLGVMAYEMLTAQLPFEADTPWQWATQHMTAQPRPFEATATSSQVPANMRSAIMRALSKDRDQRQGSARAFFEELSGGGGITVVDEQPLSAQAAVAMGSSATAAMPAAPSFGGPAAPSFGGPAAQPMAAPMAAPMMGGPAMMAGPPMAVANVPPPPQAARGGGGGKGLIFALAGVGAVLLVAMIIVFTRGSKPDEDVPLTSPFGSNSAGTTTITPQVDTTTPPEPTATATPPATDAGATTVVVKPQPTVTKPPATATATSKPPAGGAAACAQCVSAARGGNIAGAAASYRNCSDAGQKAACVSAARSQAPAAARAAALNGNCAQAKAIAAAANGMGAGSGALNSAVASCK